jgi:hypothetical protein
VNVHRRPGPVVADWADRQLLCGRLSQSWAVVRPTTDGTTVTIRIQQKPEITKIQFVLPDDIHDGAVSAVGSFNDWEPGAHRLVRRSNGTRSVSVDVPRGQEVRFRYLGSGGVWFDDPDADEITTEGALIKA